MPPFLLVTAGVFGRFSSAKFEIGRRLRGRRKSIRCNDLVRVICTINGRQTDSIHFFSAGKCMNQAKPLLRRFSAASQNLAFVQGIRVQTGVQRLPAWSDSEACSAS